MLFSISIFPNLYIFLSLILLLLLSCIDFYSLFSIPIFFSIFFIFFFFFSFIFFLVISPKPIDQEPDSSFVGILITVLTTIILLLVAIILAIIARNKRGHGGNVLDAFQHNFNPDTLGGVDNKRLNCNGMKVRYACDNYFTIVVIKKESFFN